MLTRISTTAKGERMTIPRDPTILIAGTSCVDFSSLNAKKQNGFSEKITNLFDSKNPNRKTPAFDEVSELLGEITKVIHSLGESEQTFFSMLSYVAGHKPWIVILENVKSAPFEEARDYWFNALGYTAWAGSIDTKDFYIPQTRQRKYLVAFRNEKFPRAENACAILGEAMARLEQPALPNVEDFLLGPNNPLTQIARLELEEKAQKPKMRKESSWEYSQIRHDTVRDQERLGDSRPLTQWKENGHPKFHDGLDKFAWSALPNRVYDVLDINWLRGTLGEEPFDLLFKVKVVDLSQNVDRHMLKPFFGITGCLTPSGAPYITNQCRFVLGYECLNLQGLPLWKIDFSRETQDQLKDLAGNAMSTPVVGAVFLASLMASLDDEDLKNSPWKTELGDKSHYPSPFTSSSPPLNPGEEEMGRVEEYNTAGFVGFSVEAIKEEVRKYRRYCHCNGTARYSARELMKCDICGIIRCINCAGNPAHDYRPTAPSPEPMPLRAVEHVFLRYFPTVITNLLNPSWKKSLNNLSSQSTILMNGPYKTSADSKTTTIFEALTKAKFLYQRFHITEVVTLVYTSDDGFELKVVCTESGIDWFVMLDTYSSTVNPFLQSDAELLKFCKRSQPFMKGTVQQKADSPLQAKWFMWDFAPSKVEAILSCTREETGSKFIDVELANILEIDSELFSKANEEVSGRYEAAPECEAAEYSLSVRQVPGARGQSVKLFKDPTLLGPPSQDPFVIAYEHRKLTFHEHRELLLQFSPEAKLQKLDSGFKGTFEAEIGSHWKELGD
ncbi:SNF2 family helicase [Apiospora hydei]|uniref:SNF2 family helicase n=1 Tax=Apiospora hydei TaxID=1337664 RepID=A0ABR1VLG6_9PEZI